MSILNDEVHILIFKNNYFCIIKFDVLVVLDRHIIASGGVAAHFIFGWGFFGSAANNEKVRFTRLYTSDGIGVL
jgi:hypothetical protein